MERTRGKYKLYLNDPEKPIPKTTRWRMKNTAKDATSSRELNQTVVLTGVTSDAESSQSQVKRRRLYNRDPTKKIPRQTTWYFRTQQGLLTTHPNLDQDVITPTELDATDSDLDEDVDALESDESTLAAPSPCMLDVSGCDMDQVGNLDESDGDKEEPSSSSLETTTPTHLETSVSDLDESQIIGGDLNEYQDEDQDLCKSESDDEVPIRPMRAASEPLFPGAPLTTEASWCAIMQFAISHKLTYTALSELADLIKAHCPSPNNCPSSVYKLKKHFSYLTEGCNHYRFCSACLTMIEGKTCACRSKKAEQCQLSTLPFEKHLKWIYSANWEDLQYPFTRPTTSDEIRDIHDGAVVKALAKPGKFLSIPEHTGLLLNTDGVPIFKSSKTSIWPVYLAITSLPPHIRMNCDYLLLAGIWSGPIKPNMTTLLSPVIQSCRQLESKGISIQTPDGTRKQVRAKVLLGSFDLPAKAAVANSKQYNGEYGCNYCTDKGTLVARNTRVYPPDAPHKTRTSQKMMEWAKTAERENRSVRGVKGESILSQVLQLPECIPIDYMHAILEGVFKRLMKCWFDSSNHGKPYYIGTRKEAVDKMVYRVKPPAEFRRTPRSVDDMSFWKASEYRSWLLYFSIPVLSAFLPAEYVHHLALLVSAVHILLSASITTSSLHSADAMLHTFYQLMPRLYPLQMCTANVHSLIHIVPFVRLWGPLWAFSMFGYENMNGVLKTTFHGTRKVLNQLVFTISLRQALPFISDEHHILSRTTHNRQNMLELSEHVYAIGKIRQHKLTPDEKVAIGTHTNTLLADSVPAVGRIMKDHTIYHSLMHSADAARNNCVCVFRNQDGLGYAFIRFFCLLPSAQPIAVLQMYDHTTSPTTNIRPPRIPELLKQNTSVQISRHFTSVRKLSLASTLTAVTLSDIVNKCVHIPMKGQPTDYIIAMPNPYEHH